MDKKFGIIISAILLASGTPFAAPIYTYSKI